MIEEQDQAHYEETEDADQLTFVISDEDQGERIDKWLHRELAELSRSQIQLNIDKGHITVNGKEIKTNYKLRAGDTINVVSHQPENMEIAAENIPLDIVYEDQDVVVVNKARGMVVHPAHGHYTGTLVNALLHHCTDLSGINGILRPGIVHRIDKDTTGLLVVAKNDLAHQHLAKQFKEHSISRKYVALVHGLLPNKEGTIIAPIARHKTQRKRMAVDVETGKHAVTHFQVLQYFHSYTLAELRLETGRTHQIRVHMQYIGHPVAGDPEYGFRKTVPLDGQALHARDIGFVHPRTNQWMSFSSNLPKDFQEILATDL